MEIGINTIVMLIVGITVLGLVIGFVTNMIGSASKQFDPAGDIEKRNQQAALNTPGYFGVAPEILDITDGEIGKIFIKIKNQESEDTLTVESFETENDLEDKVTAGSGEVRVSLSKIMGFDDCKFNINSPSITISPKEEQVIPIVFEPTKCSAGDEFFLKLEFDPDGSEKYLKTKTLTLKITE